MRMLLYGCMKTLLFRSTPRFNKKINFPHTLLEQFKDISPTIHKSQNARNFCLTGTRLPNLCLFKKLDRLYHPHHRQVKLIGVFSE